MTFRGKEIPYPTLKMVDYFVRKRGMKIIPSEVYLFMRERNWRNSQGVPYATLENAIIGYETLRKPAKPQAIKKRHIPYKEQLQDKRWFAFRDKVFKFRGHKCEQCGSMQELQVHHRRYIYGKYAWEYKMKDVIVLCAECHRRKHALDIERKEMIALMDKKCGQPED